MFSRKSILFFIGLAVTLAVNADDLNPRPRYHVDILKLNDDDTLEHLCNGAILHLRYVITAAHCVDKFEGKQLRIRSGSDVAPPADMPHQDQRLYHRVEKIMLPADFVNTPCRSHEHDIAIMKVNREFDLTYDTLYKQVYLPEYSNDYEGYEAYISGYTNNELKTLGAKVISNEECSRNATSIITRGNLCATVAEDVPAVSSTPLLYENTLIGFMNAPTKCTSSPGVRNSFECVEQPTTLKMFTRITTYLEFIRKVLNSQASADIIYRS